MKRQIFEVDKRIIGMTGNNYYVPVPSGYPKVFDSRSYSGDINKTLKRATGEFCETFGAMCKNDTRQLQTVILMSADGFVLRKETIGEIADDPNV